MLLMLQLLLAAFALAPALGATLHKKYNTGNQRVNDGRVNVHIIVHTHDVSVRCPAGFAVCNNASLDALFPPLFFSAIARQTF